MFCPACGQESPESARFCQYCGQLLAAGPQAGTSEPAATPQPPIRYAGFWRRFFAYVLDGILVFVIATGGDAVAGLALGVDVGLAKGIHAGARQAASAALGCTIGTAAAWLYWALLESSPFQATLGKMALAIQVTDLHGQPISFARATGRYFGKFISALLFGFGFTMAGWTEKKQALHDFMAGTLLVRK